VVGAGVIATLMIGPVERHLVAAPQSLSPRLSPARWRNRPDI